MSTSASFIHLIECSHQTKQYMSKLYIEIICWNFSTLYQVNSLCTCMLKTFKSLSMFMVHCFTTKREMNKTIYTTSCKYCVSSQRTAPIVISLNITNHLNLFIFRECHVSRIRNCYWKDKTFTVCHQGLMQYFCF